MDDPEAKPPAERLAEILTAAVEHMAGPTPRMDVSAAADAMLATGATHAELYAAQEHYMQEAFERDSDWPRAADNPFRLHVDGYRAQMRRHWMDAFAIAHNRLGE